MTQPTEPTDSGQTTPPPLPTSPQIVSYRTPGADEDAFEQYHAIAETVGFMPSIRLRDNIIQGAVVAAGTVIGALVGWITGQSILAAAFGGGIGFALFGILSGVVLMVIGWIRLLKKRRRY
jgi:hypothetical protein